MNKADRIRAALADPDSPLYGSDLVPLIDDYVNEAEERRTRAGMSGTLIEFKQTGDFAACMAAEQWCIDNGYSVGEMQRGDPRGLLQGDYAIAKWRNLSSVERKALHGEMRGDMRNGPVVIELFPVTPTEEPSR